MQELIKTTKNDGGEVVVSGRDLHEFLDISTRYNDWFERMCQYGFIENTDFIAITQKRVTAQGNETTSIDHAMKLDMAKEISMLQRNEKGKQARQYFIEVEKQYQLDTENLSPELKMFNGLFKALANQEIKTKELSTKIDDVSEIVALNTTDWRKDTRILINKIAKKQGGYSAYAEIQSSIHAEVERRGGVNLGTRLTNKRRRMADEGVAKSRRDKLTKVDIIADDKKLVEIYTAVVKEYAIKYGVWNEVVA